MKKIYILFIIIIISLTACVSKKEAVYLREYDDKELTDLKSFELTIKPDDALIIQIDAETPNPEITAMYNLGGSGAGGQLFASYTNTFLVNNEGFIEIPTLGKLQVSGLKRSEIEKIIIEKASVFIKNPRVIVRITNFEITVNGEVTKPGVFRIETERITLIEALALAGDLTIFGKRNNILVLREVNNKPTFNTIDITKRDFIHSDFYYLKQNDVIYVEPRKTKIDSTAIGPNVLATLQIISFLITTTLLITRLK